MMNKWACLILSLVLPWCGLRAESSPAESLPELPSVESNAGQELNLPPERSELSAPMPAVTPPPPSRRMPTADELEKVRKERNWMVEGMKEQQAAARLEAEKAKNGATPLQDSSNMDMSQSIIDMVLNKKKREQALKQNQSLARKRGEQAAANPSAITGFQPALSNNSFTNANSIESPGSNSLENSILQQERQAARQAGFIEGGLPPGSDPFNNPFSNLPIPEDALPQNPSPSAQARNKPGINPSASPGLQNDFQPSVPGSTNPMMTPTTPEAVVASSPGPATPRIAVEQPYTLLREQELVRQQQQNKSIRPKPQDLRSRVPDPSEARLF